jgi:hypothetical protein
MARRTSSSRDVRMRSLSTPASLTASSMRLSPSSNVKRFGSNFVVAIETS